MNPSRPHHPTSLIDVQLAFEHWRSDRTSRRSTPEHLRVLAVGLLEDHPPSVVYKALGINSSTLKQWAAQERKTSTTSFVSLPDDRPKSVITKPLAVESTILISLPNGVQVNLLQGATLNDVLAAAHSLGKSA